MRSRRRFALFSIIVVGMLVAALGTALYLNSRRGRIAETDSIVVAYSPFENTTLLWIADERHFFEQNGLKVTLRKYDTGAGSLDAVLNGEAEVSLGVAEFPVVGTVLKKEKIRALASIAKLNQIYIVGRKDRGLKRPADISGKKVGTTLGTIAHFYLGRWLSLNGMDIKDISLVDVATPAEWVDTVANGDIDAIATAQPYANLAKQRLGANAVFRPAQGGQPLFGLIVSTDRWTADHPRQIGKLLNSLVQAEEYLTHHRDKAKGIVKKRLNLDAVYMDTVWSKNEFSLSLDQSLIVAMEDEARWLINNDLTTAKRVPDFSNYVHLEGLRAIKPESVKIIR